MPEVYKKIEKKIVKLKEKEELWKGRYREIAQQVEELVDSNSKQFKDMEKAIDGLEERVQKAEAQTRKAGEMSEEVLRLMDRRISDLSGMSKELSEKLVEKGEDIKRLKSEVASQVSGMIARHEKTFDSVLEKIGLAARRVESELQKEEGLYEKMESAKRFMDNYVPTVAARPEPPRPANDFYPEAPLSQTNPVPHQAIPPAPIPERFQPEAAFAYSPQPVAQHPAFMMHAPRAMRHIDFDDIDDEMDMDDTVSGNMKGFKESVESMNSNVSSITEKLASIEEKMAKIQVTRSPALERLDDKIRMYSQSVAGMHGRMETVEKALRDGMTPMMESLKLLTESVKSLKEESRSGPRIQKPEPPRPNVRVEGLLAPTPSNRMPQSFQRIPGKKPGKSSRPSRLGVEYG